MLNVAASPDPSPTDGRTHPRRSLSVPARVLIDGAEHVATLRDVSLSGLALECLVRPRVGAEAIVYADGLARMQGRVARLFRRGFGVGFELSERARERLAERIERAIGSDGTAESAPVIGLTAPTASSATCRCEVEGGEALTVRVLDVSVVGMTFESRHRPPLGTTVRLRGSEGQVVRHTATGFAIEFPSYWRNVPRWAGRVAL